MTALNASGSDDNTPNSLPGSGPYTSRNSFGCLPSESHGFADEVSPTGAFALPAVLDISALNEAWMPLHGQDTGARNAALPSSRQNIFDAHSNLNLPITHADDLGSHPRITLQFWRVRIGLAELCAFASNGGFDLQKLCGFLLYLHVQTFDAGHAAMTGLRPVQKIIEWINDALTILASDLPQFIIYDNRGRFGAAPIAGAMFFTALLEFDFQRLSAFEANDIRFFRLWREINAITHNNPPQRRSSFAAPDSAAIGVR